MNELFNPPPPRPTTRAADGLPRWRWTIAEVERLAAAGFFGEYDSFELLGGELVPMSPKGRRHEIVREELTFRFTKLASPEIFVAAEPQFNLSADTYTVPIPECWVINASTLMTTVHLRPAGRTYDSINELSSDARLVPHLAQSLAISLNELTLG